MVELKLWGVFRQGKVRNRRELRGFMCLELMKASLVCPFFDLRGFNELLYYGKKSRDFSSQEDKLFVKLQSS